MLLPVLVPVLVIEAMDEMLTIAASPDFFISGANGPRTLAAKMVIPAKPRQPLLSGRQTATTDKSGQRRGDLFGLGEALRDGRADAAAAADDDGHFVFQVHGWESLG